MLTAQSFCKLFNETGQIDQYFSDIMNFNFNFSFAYQYMVDAKDSLEALQRQLGGFCNASTSNAQQQAEHGEED